MSALKTVAGFAVVGVLLASGIKSERQFDLEADTSVQRAVEQGVRQYAAGYDPRVALTMPELRNFSMGPMRVTRSRAGAFLDSTFGNGDQGYDVYARFREGDADKCMTLTLEWKVRSASWRVDHTGPDDRCDPIW